MQARRRMTRPGHVIYPTSGRLVIYRALNIYSSVLPVIRLSNVLDAIASISLVRDHYKFLAGLIIVVVRVTLIVFCIDVVE